MEGDDGVVMEEGQVIVSLNSFFSNICTGSRTMKIRVSIGNMTLHILIDMGSSHNFLSNKIFKFTTDKVKDLRHLQITIADGGRIKGTQMVENFSWSMQGQLFIADVILFRLARCDMILGMQWLGILGAITWDCLNLTMEFFKDGQRMKLMGCKEGKNKLLIEDKVQHQMKELQTYNIQVAPWQEDS